MTENQLKLAADQAACGLEDLWGGRPADPLPEGFADGVLARLPACKPLGFARLAACLLLALALAGGSLMALSPQVRAAVFGWITHEVPGGTGYQYQGVDNNGRIPDYRLGYVPDGFAPVTPVCDGGSINQSFFGLQGRGQFLAIKDNKAYPYALYLDTEGEEPVVEHVRIGRHPAEYYTVKDGRSAALVWRSEDGAVLFCITGPFTEQTMIAMAESLYVEQKEVPIA